MIRRNYALRKLKPSWRSGSEMKGGPSLLMRCPAPPTNAMVYPPIIALEDDWWSRQRASTSQRRTSISSIAETRRTLTARPQTAADVPYGQDTASKTLPEPHLLRLPPQYAWQRHCSYSTFPTPILYS